MPRRPPEFENWVSRAPREELAAIKRWFHLEVEADVGAGATILLRRVLAWDDSPAPDWVRSQRHGRLVVRCSSAAHVDIQAVVSDLRNAGTSIDEVRRVELPVTDWSSVASAEMWNLGLPVVAYELWASEELHARAREVWNTLDALERQSSGINEALLGYLGSTVVLIPQLRPFLVSHTDLVIPGATELWGELRIVSEVLDGAITIDRSVNALNIGPARPLEPAERSRMLQVHNVASRFAEMNGAGPTTRVDGLAVLPSGTHGWSGSDWRLTVVCPDDADSTVVGLVRGIGSGYFTQEPWRERSPALGFSGPARVHHVPPNAASGAAAFSVLVRAGSPACLCDPYAEDGSLEGIGPILKGARVVTTRRTITQGRLTRAWARKRGVTVKTVSQIHDRFLVGSRHGFLIGYSLNGLGNQHSFIIELDNSMRLEVARVFETLWTAGADAW
jgi:hypothetical protein